jgi:hypothetical protein
VTEPKTIPFRPSANLAQCGDNRWHNPSTGTCHNGYAFNVSFDLSASGVVASDDIIVSVAYNTQTRGYAPTNVSGPYDSLNVSLALAGPTAGTDETATEVFRSTGAGAFGISASPTGTGLVLEIGADSALVPSPTTDVVVNQRDVKPSEIPSTYQQWHEGKNNATPAYSVHPDGLHLGDGASSTIIKGTDVANSAISKADLRALIIAGASVNVVEASNPALLPTFQVPLAFGTALTPGNFTFTTLQTSLVEGANTFTLGEDWRTSKAFGGYLVQGTDSLGDFLDAIYAGGNTVWLFGFGVQADAPSVIDEVVWDATRYTFFQPEIAACTPPLGSVAASNLASNGWTFSQTRAQGHNEFTAGGLHIWTESNTSLDKAAGYRAINIPLADVGVVGIEFADGFVGRPGLQLGFDKDGDGGFDGYLVGEPWANYVSGDGWSPTTNGDWAKAQFWNSNAALGLPDNWGYANAGTLNDYLAYWPDAPRLWRARRPDDHLDHGRM